MHNQIYIMFPTYNRATILLWLLYASLTRLAFASVVSTGNFSRDFYIHWAPSHVNTSAGGWSRSIKLDQESGGAFASNDKFLFGQIDMKIRLIPGYSAGTVVSFYLTSDDPKHDELDFEFLGNVTGQPYILQTNIYADGFDNREERVQLWFDPTAHFHTYSILWNLHQIVFMVDWVPIRVYRNHADQGVPFPQWRPMSIKASVWNGENWATRGGLDKIDWSKGPFIAKFKDYKIDACTWRGDPNVCRGSTDWWHQPRFRALTVHQRRQFEWVKLHHTVYDYCQDNTRFQGSLPKECSLPKY